MNEMIRGEDWDEEENRRREERRMREWKIELKKSII
jgi:hypothetical protein